MLHPNYVQGEIPVSVPSQFESEIAQKMDTPEKRCAVVAGVLHEGQDFLDCPGSLQAKYMAERQSQGLFDFWHFSAVYYAQSERADAAKELMMVFSTIAANRPHYMVENWHSKIVELCQ